MQDDKSVPSQTSHATAVHSSSWRRTAIAIVIIALIAGTGGYLLGIGTKQHASQSTQRVSLQPSPPITAQSSIYTPSPSSQQVTGTMDWKMYINQKYSYQVKYPPDKSYEELPVLDNGYTDFLFGCFRVFVVHPGFDDRDLQQRTKLTGIPWTKLNELENVTKGGTKTYPVDEWKIGAAETFTLKYFYKKLPNKQIGGLNWNAFEVTNNFENHAVHNIYFTNKNNRRYLIDMRSYGPCYEDEPVQMLSTFKFIN